MHPILFIIKVRGALLFVLLYVKLIEENKVAVFLPFFEKGGDHLGYVNQLDYVLSEPIVK